MGVPAQQSESARDRRETRMAWAIHQLAVDANAVEAVRALRSQGIRPILLKGASFARWLYADPLSRLYGDVDLLVAPEQHALAGETLERLGYRNHTEDAAAHACMWIRGELPEEIIDLHRRLCFTTVGDGEVWAALSESTDTLELGAIAIEVLDVRARAMLVALHAAWHGARVRKPLDDLALALVQVDDETWTRAAQLAQQIGVGDEFATGLRLQPAGAALAARLGLTTSASVYVHLHAGTVELTSLGLMQLLELGSWRARAALLQAELVPSPAFIRTWRPVARRGRGGLALAYLWRPLWLVWKLPRATWALARAHRRATIESG